MSAERENKQVCCWFGLGSQPFGAIAAQLVAECLSQYRLGQDVTLSCKGTDKSRSREILVVADVY
jgi:hypothetical protein